MPLPHAQTSCLLPYLLTCCCPTDALEPSAAPAGAGLGEPPSAALQRCLLSVCATERGEASLAREQLGNSGREWPLGRSPHEEEMLSQVEDSAGKAGKGVRSLQGRLSTVISCKGCELAALGSFTLSGRGEAAKGTV